MAALEPSTGTHLLPEMLPSLVPQPPHMPVFRGLDSLPGPPQFSVSPSENPQRHRQTHSSGPSFPTPPSFHPPQVASTAVRLGALSGKLPAGSRQNLFFPMVGVSLLTIACESQKAGPGLGGGAAQRSVSPWGGSREPSSALHSFPARDAVSGLLQRPGPIP